MIVERFDRRAMAAMEEALEKACERWPNGGTHRLRKRVAQSIIRCAETGNISLDTLTEAGERALALLPQGGRSQLNSRALRFGPIGKAPHRHRR